MKFSLALCILAVVALPSVKPQTNADRGCIYFLGECQRECEEGTHAYATGCSPLLPEATCDEPNPTFGESRLCDFSKCFCDPPTVRDSASGKCVPLDQCPTKE